MEFVVKTVGHCVMDKISELNIHFVGVSKIFFLNTLPNSLCVMNFESQSTTNSVAIQFV